jgi:hypothetical protein
MDGPAIFKLLEEWNLFLDLEDFKQMQHQQPRTYQRNHCRYLPSGLVRDGLEYGQIFLNITFYYSLGIIWSAYIEVSMPIATQEGDESTHTLPVIPLILIF